jgi:hypothetical protein
MGPPLSHHRIEHVTSIGFPIFPNFIKNRVHTSQLGQFQESVAFKLPGRDQST